MHWQPISTAPKDGTYILAWDGYKIAVTSFGFDDLWDHEPKKWCVGECYGEYNIYDTIDPTHWKPLPDPPPE